MSTELYGKDVYWAIAKKITPSVIVTALNAYYAEDEPLDSDDYDEEAKERMLWAIKAAVCEMSGVDELELRYQATQAEQDRMQADAMLRAREEWP